MKNKLKPGIHVNIARTIFFDKYENGGINIHHRDGKRIVQRKIWNSRKIHYDDDSFVCVTVVQSGWSDVDSRDWLLELKDLRNGETRVSPMYEIEVVKHSHRVPTNNGYKNFIVFKKK